ncbi:hypothetical protein DSECCO2_197250 [anaerobic digester metagenome]
MNTFLIFSGVFIFTIAVIIVIGRIQKKREICESTRPEIDGDDRNLDDLKPGEIVDLGDGFIIQDGKIKGEIKLSTNLGSASSKIEIPVEKFMRNMELKEQRESDPDSCEREPDADEVKIPVEGFFDKYKSIIPDYNDVFEKSRSAYWRGYNNFIIKKYVLSDMDELRRDRESRDHALRRTAQLNNEGMKCEKDGDIDSAIRIYEENIKFEYPASHSYDRLMILYRKRKDYDSEIRVINAAISAYNKDSKRRASDAIRRHPELKVEILHALEHGNSVKDKDGIYCFSPHSVEKYVTRLEKLKLKLNNDKNKS